MGSFTYSFLTVCLLLIAILPLGQVFAVKNCPQCDTQYDKSQTTWPEFNKNNSDCGSTDPSLVNKFILKCPSWADSKVTVGCRTIVYAKGWIYRDCVDYTVVEGKELLNTTAIANGDASCFTSNKYLGSALIPVCVSSTCVGALCNPSLDKPISKDVWIASTVAGGDGSDGGSGNVGFDTGPGGDANNPAAGLNPGGAGNGNGQNNAMSTASYIPRASYFTFSALLLNSFILLRVNSLL